LSPPLCATFLGQFNALRNAENSPNLFSFSLRGQAVEDDRTFLVAVLGALAKGQPPLHPCPAQLGETAIALETIQESYGTLQLFIRDALLRQRVRCYFPEDMLPAVFEQFRKRVEVSGIIHYRKNGTPISIEAEHIIGLPDDSELPSFEDVRGILS
jgi:hypothetical protein